MYREGTESPMCAVYTPHSNDGNMLVAYLTAGIVNYIHQSCIMHSAEFCVSFRDLIRTFSYTLHIPGPVEFHENGNTHDHLSR